MSVLFDSSAWFAYSADNNKVVGKIVESEVEILISVMSLFEVKRILLKRGANQRILDKTMSFIRYRSRIIDVTKDIAETAADLSVKHKLSTADAIIYATALSKNAELITGDSDLAGLKGVQFIQ